MKRMMGTLNVSQIRVFELLHVWSKNNKIIYDQTVKPLKEYKKANEQKNKLIKMLQ